MPPRPFSLRDALILIAATAAGLAMTRDLTYLEGAGHEVSTNVKLGVGKTLGYGTHFFDYDFSIRDRMVPRRLSDRMGLVVLWPMPCLTALTLSVLASGFGRTRWDVRGPCEALGVAVVLALAFNAVLFPSILQEVVFPSRPGRVFAVWLNWRVLFWYTLPKPAGLAVAASWSCLWLSGPRETFHRWQDHAAAWLGALWIGLAVTSLAANWVRALGY